MSNAKAIDGSKANKAATNIASSLSNEPTVAELVWHISVIQETLCESIDEDVDGIIASIVVGTSLAFSFLFFCLEGFYLADFSHLMSLLLLLGNGRSLTQLTGGCSYGTKSLKEVALSGMYESNLSRKQGIIYYFVRFVHLYT